jgi:hypothetical protein
MKQRLRCPKCHSGVITKGVLTLYARQTCIECDHCATSLRVTFNELAVVVASVLWGGIGWFLGFVGTYGVGYPAQAAFVASMIGIVAAAIASCWFAFRLSEVR